MKLRGSVKSTDVAILTLLGVGLLAVVGQDAVDLRGQRALRSAQARLLALHGQTIRLAAERGSPMRLIADPSTQIVTIEEGCSGGGRVLVSRDFNLSYRVDIRTGERALDLCLGPETEGVLDRVDSARRAIVTLSRGGHVATVDLSRTGSWGEDRGPE